MEASDASEVLHISKERVRDVLQTRAAQSPENGPPHREDAERRLGDTDANRVHRGSPNSATNRETRFDNSFLQKTVIPIRRAFVRFRECRWGFQRVDGVHEPVGEPIARRNNRGFFRQTSRVSAIVIQKRRVEGGRVILEVYPTNRANNDTIRS